MLIVLTAILITLILLICGDKGSKSILSTAMNAGLLLLAVFLIYRGLDPILITVAACILIACITLFIPEEANIKSKTALLSVILVILVVVPFVYSIAGRASIQGFTSEQYEITDSNGYTRNIGIDMLSLQLSVMIIALIGAVTDIAVAITSSIYEIRSSNENISKAQLLTSAFSVSKAVLSTSIHTIFYIYIAEYMTLMIQYAGEYSFVKLINSKSFCQEFISISISGIGCCLVVPVSALLMTWVLERKRAQTVRDI